MEQPRSDRYARAEDAAPPRVKTVLIVDDDAGVRTRIRRILEPGGHRVLEAGNPDDAFRAAEGHPIHLLVIDVVLPAMNGFVLAQALSAFRPEARILYMSGCVNQDVLAEVAAENPGVTFLPKPFTSEMLAARARALLDDLSGRPA